MGRKSPQGTAETCASDRHAFGAWGLAPAPCQTIIENWTASSLTMRCTGRHRRLCICVFEWLCGPVSPVSAPVGPLHLSLLWRVPSFRRYSKNTGRYTMRNRVVLSVLGLCALLVTGLFLRPLLVPAVAQTPTRSQTSTPSTIGRYQLTISATGATYFLDTATGRLWHYEAAVVVVEPQAVGYKTISAHWVEMGPLVAKPSP